MNQNEQDSEIGIEMQLELDDQSSCNFDDDYGNKNYGNVEANDLFKMSRIDSIDSDDQNQKSASDLETSFHNDLHWILEFNPDQRPPDLELAKKHARARRVAKNKQLGSNESVSSSFCPCCGNQIENELLPITIEREKLGFLGSGVPLFFEWLIFNILLCSILIFCSVYTMVQNLQGSGCEIEQQCSQKFLVFNFDINRIMTANRKGEYIDHTQSKINFLSTCVLILVTIIYQSFFRHIDQRIESRFITPSHFTIMVEDIPVGATDAQIKKFFQEIIPNEGIEVVKVVQGYGISDLSKIKSLRTKLIKKENSLFGREFKLKDQIKLKKDIQQGIIKPKKKKIDKKESTIEQDIEEIKCIANEKIEIRKKILRIDKSINEICKSYSTHLKNTGYAFISFKNEDSVQKITDHFPTNNIQRFFSYLCCQNDKSFMGSFVKVSKAPEPGDILWENLVYSKHERLKRRLISLFHQFIALCLSFILIYLIKIFQVNLNNWENLFIQFFTINNKTFIRDRSEGNAIVENLALAMSVLTFVINIIMSKFIKKQSANEKHQTYTQYLISVDQSLGIAQFINSILISVIVDHLENGKDLMIEGGVVLSIQYNVLVNTLFPIFNQFFNYWYIIRLCRRRKIIKQGDKCSLTQYEAHKIFEGTTFNVDRNYSITIRLMLVNCFVGYICPNVMIWSLLVMIGDYWLEKYLLLRRHISPPAISGDLFFANINFFNDLYVLVYSVIIFFLIYVGCCYWQYMIYDEVDDWTVVQLQFSIFYYIMPIKKIISLCSQIQQNPNTHKTYKNVSQYFFNDYDRANPATQQYALSEWMKKMEKNFNKDIAISDKKLVSASFLRNSQLKSVPRKIIAESESFPFFQYRNMKLNINQPFILQFLDRSQGKNKCQKDHSKQSGTNKDDSFRNNLQLQMQKHDESSLKKQSISHQLQEMNKIPSEIPNNYEYNNNLQQKKYSQPIKKFIGSEKQIFLNSDSRSQSINQKPNNLKELKIKNHKVQSVPSHINRNQFDEDNNQKQHPSIQQKQINNIRQNEIQQSDIKQKAQLYNKDDMTLELNRLQ